MTHQIVKLWGGAQGGTSGIEEYLSQSNDQSNHILLNFSIHASFKFNYLSIKKPNKFTQSKMQYKSSEENPFKILRQQVQIFIMQTEAKFPQC